MSLGGDLEGGFGGEEAGWLFSCVEFFGGLSEKKMRTKVTHYVTMTSLLEGKGHS